MGVNITEVRFLNVPLENDYKHTLYFATKSAQENYFASKVVKTMDNCSYQRKDKIIRASFHIDTMYNCNYVMYKNKAYGDRWFYAFITDMEYVDDGRTDIHIETDVMQTWKFDVTIRPSFIEREHVTDDTIGLHTVPEQLETGEYTCQDAHKFTGLTECGIILACTVNLAQLDKDKCDPVHGGKYAGIYSGIRYYYFPAKQVQNQDGSVGGIDALNNVIATLANKGQSDAIVSIFIVPTFCVALNDPITVDKKNGDSVLKFNTVMGGDAPFMQRWTLDKPTSILTYTPKNKKLLTYPYCYMNVTNNNGANAIYQYEFFSIAKPQFCVYGSITPGCSIRLVPASYCNIEENHQSALTGGKFPICGWTNDIYTNWLTQNSINIGVSLASAGLQIAGGVASAIATGGVGIAVGVGTATSGVLNVANTVGEIYKHSLTPPQAEGNQNSGDICYSSGNLTFTAYDMCIKPEFAKIIDGYFTMFGYKVNVVKTPNTNHRNNFWFTKTVDVNLDGAIPNKDLQRIKDCYNNGITFWRYPANIGNYSVDNSII